MVQPARARVLCPSLQVVNPGFVATPLTARNPFTVPFLITAEWAAEAYYRGRGGGRFEIAFRRRPTIARESPTLPP